MPKPSEKVPEDVAVAEEVGYEELMDRVKHLNEKGNSEAERYQMAAQLGERLEDSEPTGMEVEELLNLDQLFATLLDGATDVSESGIELHEAEKQRRRIAHALDEKMLEHAKTEGSMLDGDNATAAGIARLESQGYQIFKTLDPVQVIAFHSEDSKIGGILKSWRKQVEEKNIILNKLR